MKSLKTTVTAITLLLSIAVSSAQIKNAKTENVKIFGNCGMCKAKIEKSGSLKNTATVDWDKDSKMAVITYDSNKTNQDKILKRIALAGYDSENNKAPESSYVGLPGCCQYDRKAKKQIQSK